MAARKVDGTGREVGLGEGDVAPVGAAVHATTSRPSQAHLTLQLHQGTRRGSMRHLSTTSGNSPQLRLPAICATGATASTAPSWSRSKTSSTPSTRIGTMCCAGFEPDHQRRSGGNQQPGPGSEETRRATYRCAGASSCNTSTGCLSNPRVPGAVIFVSASTSHFAKAGRPFILIAQLPGQRRGSAHQLDYRVDLGDERVARES